MKRAILAVTMAAMVAGCGDGEPTAVGNTAAAGDTAAVAGGLEDGTYTCVYNSGGMLFTLGNLQIRGDQYSGFSGDKWGTYSGTKETSFTFHDGLVGMPDGYTVTASRWLTSTYSGEQYLEIAYVSPSDNVLTSTCSKE